MSFFIRGKQVNGIKRAKYANDKNKKRKTKPTSSINHEVTSSEDEDFPDQNVAVSSSEDEHETAQEKKVRLAKVYLEEIEKEERNRLEKDEVDQSVLSKRLREDYLKETGKLRLSIAEKYKGYDKDNITILKCREHHKVVTCFSVSSDNEFLYVGSLDGVVIKYSLVENKKVGSIPFIKKPVEEEPIKGHSSSILSIALTTDDKYLAIGDLSGSISIWDPKTLTFLKKLTGHKFKVTGLAFKKDSHTLYSCSKDRTAKVWSLDEMAYVETLFGHQDSISAIDTLYRDRVVTCGGRDLRIWKIPEETQLIFNGHRGNIDNVKLINEENFVTGGDDGDVCVWSILRKKPLCVVQKAHGEDDSNLQPFWITAVAPFINSDLMATGSNNGVIKLWRLENNFKLCRLLFEIPVEGFVNLLSFTSDGKKLIAAIGKENRLGRWTTVKTAKNCILVIPLTVE